MGTNPGSLFSAPTGTFGPASMPVCAPLKGITIKEPSTSQKVDFVDILEGKSKARMMETENQYLVSSSDYPSYRTENDVGTSSPYNFENVEILSTDLSSFELSAESTPAPIDITTHVVYQLNDQSLFAKVAMQFDLHKLADVALNESAMITFEE